MYPQIRLGSKLLSKQCIAQHHKRGCSKEFVTRIELWFLERQNRPIDPNCRPQHFDSQRPQRTWASMFERVLAGMACALEGLEVCVSPGTRFDWSLVPKTFLVLFMPGREPIGQRYNMGASRETIKLPIVSAHAWKCAQVCMLGLSRLLNQFSYLIPSPHNTTLVSLSTALFLRLLRPLFQHMSVS